MAERAREFGDSCGFELYCWAHTKFKGVGPAQGQAVYQAVAHPARCKTTAELRESLTQMARDIREYEA